MSYFNKKRTHAPHMSYFNKNVLMPHTCLILIKKRTHASHMSYFNKKRTHASHMTYFNKKTYSCLTHVLF